MTAVPYMKSIRAKRNNRSAFTLVEILIVVIILGILAAIVIPQFTNASNDARKGNVLAQLQTLRAQIQLYKLQHKDQPPLLITGDSANPWGVLTKYTDITGQTSPTATSSCIYGPYYQHPPVNPLAPAGSGSTIGPAANGAVGWVYDEATGLICASGTDSNKCLNESDGTDSVNPTW